MRTFLTSDRFINAFKTMLACFIGLVVLHYFHLASGQWLIITVLVVMSAQMHVGGALQKGYLRFVGTLLGACIAGLALWLGAGNQIVFDIIVLASALFFSYIAGISQVYGQAGTLGAVTVAILLLTPHETWANAIWRVTEILFGIILALGVSVFIAPIRASKKWRLQLSLNLLALKEYYLAILNNDMEQSAIVEEKIMKYFLISKKLQDEAKNELRFSSKSKKAYQEILLHEKRLFRAFSLFEHYAAKYLQVRDQFSASQSIIGDALSELALHLEKSDQGKIELPDFTQMMIDIPEQHFAYFFVYFVTREIPTLAGIINRLSK